MADLGQHGFDANQVEPSTDFDAIPAGKYVAAITDSDMRPNSKGTGEYLWLEFTIVDGPFASRRLWTQLNLSNPSSQAVEIAQRELSSICRAVGKLRIHDSIELHNIPLELNVKVKNSPEYGQQNVIRGFKAIESNRHAAPTASAAPAAKPRASAPPAAAPPSGPTNSSVPPWKRE